MGLCSNLDDLLSYSTVKEVVIQDKRLGFMKYTLMIGIAIFILLYQILYMNHYLLTQEPTGTIRFSLRGPTANASCDVLKTNCDNDYRMFDELPYCQQNPACTDKKIGCPYNCTYLDAVGLSDQQERTLLIASRLEQMNQTKTPCGLNPPPNKQCKRVWDNSQAAPTSFYIADIESYTLMIDHAFTTTEDFGLTKTARVMQGFLESQNKTQCDMDPHPRKTFDYNVPWVRGVDDVPCLLNSTNRTADGSELFYNSISKLLSAGNIELDKAGDLPQMKTHRKEGLLLMVEVEYKNSRPWWGVYPNYQDVSYVLRIKPVDESTYKETEVTYKATEDMNRVVLTRYGIRMTALLIGSLGKFDMTTLLLQLTSSLGLIAVATLIVDYAAIYALKDRKRYKKAKYEKTEAFGQDILFSSHGEKQSNDVYEDNSDDPLIATVN